jgi:hypothetical protein
LPFDDIWHYFKIIMLLSSATNEGYLGPQKIYRSSFCQSQQMG